MVVQILRIGTAAALLAMLTTNSLFAVGKCKKACCPKCQTCCELKIEEGTEEKHSWKTKEKIVCIPKVTFSWQWPFQKKKCQQTCDAGCTKPCCAPPKLARTRTVCTLVKETYECPVCKYKWVPKEAKPCTVCEDCEGVPASPPIPVPQPLQMSQQSSVPPPPMEPVDPPVVSRPVVFPIGNQ